MAMASGLIEATTPRPLDDWTGGGDERPDGPSTFLSFGASEWPAMGALALAVAALHPDELLVARLRRSVDADVLVRGPSWLASIADISVTGTLMQTDPLRDGENLMISWDWSTGSGTAVVYVDHNMGTIVKDAFALPEDGEAVLAHFGSIGAQHMVVEPIDPADARARILEALDAGDHTMPPLQTDTWPASRPMVEWLVRHLPSGGTGYVGPEWSSDERDELVDEFLASPFGTVKGLTEAQVGDLADPLVWFACDYGPGDPLRWSPVSVEIVLADWYPRKVLARSDELRRLPDVVAGFVRFAHQRKGIPADITTDTLAAVERWRDDFLRAIGSIEDRDDLDGDWLHDEDEDDEAFMERALAEVEAAVVQLVGGRENYEALDDEPLGDVPFDWSRVPPEIREPTAETLEHLDRWSGELFDAEVRTIARVLLAGVVAADPSVFKRSDRTDGLAAACLWFLVQRLTGRFSAAERREMPWKVLTQKDLAAATGVSASSIGGRARTIANVVDRADIDWPSYLHSTQRQEALRTRELVASWHDAHR